MVAFLPLPTAPSLDGLLVLMIDMHLRSKVSPWHASNLQEDFEIAAKEKIWEILVSSIELNGIRIQFIRLVHSIFLWGGESTMLKVVKVKASQLISLFKTTFSFAG